MNASTRMLFPYVVKYDSGFAPNPFYGFCTLATCKPRIRNKAKIDDWIVGTGTYACAAGRCARADRLVYAMRVTESMDFKSYWSDPRFSPKKPMRCGSHKQSCGDNIYYRNDDDTAWLQRDSFHTDNDGVLNPEHVKRDTKVDRVLISDDFYYFGGQGPKIPKKFRDDSRYNICPKIRVTKYMKNEGWIAEFVDWLRSHNESGYLKMPMDWLVENETVSKK